jgi:hypothetical protein
MEGVAVVAATTCDDLALLPTLRLPLLCTNSYVEKRLWVMGLILAPNLPAETLVDSGRWSDRREHWVSIPWYKNNT